MQHISGMKAVLLRIMTASFFAVILASCDTMVGADGTMSDAGQGWNHDNSTTARPTERAGNENSLRTPGR